MLDGVPDALGLQGLVRVQPIPEQRLEFMWQAHQRPGGGVCPRLGHGGQDGLDLGIVQEGNHRRHHGPHRHTGAVQLGNGLQPAVRGAGARLQPLGEAGIQAGHGDENTHQLLFRQRHQEVEIAQDQRVLGDDGDRMPGFQQYLQQAARDAPGALDGLVGIGVAADVQGTDLVAWAGQFPAQEVGRIRLGEEFRLEVEAGREVQVGMRGPGIAVDAAMLAALIRVEGLAEGNVGRGVARDDTPALLHGDGGGQRCEGVRPGRPAIMLRLAAGGEEAVVRVEGGATPLAGTVGIHAHGGLRGRGLPYHNTVHMISIAVCLRQVLELPLVVSLQGLGLFRVPEQRLVHRLKAVGFPGGDLRY